MAAAGRIRGAHYRDEPAVEPGGAPDELVDGARLRRHLTVRVDDQFADVIGYFGVVQVQTSPFSIRRHQPRDLVVALIQFEPRADRRFTGSTGNQGRLRVEPPFVHQVGLEFARRSRWALAVLVAPGAPWCDNYPLYEAEKAVMGAARVHLVLETRPTRPATSARRATSRRNWRRRNRMRPISAAIRSRISRRSPTVPARGTACGRPGCR